MSPTPPSLAAVERYPTLHGLQPALAAQQRRVAERLRSFVPRSELIAEFDTLLGELGSGLLLLEGPAGAGATTLLCQLASERAYPIWLPSDDETEGLGALCAQLIALHHLPLALVPPAAERDTLTLDWLLAEAAAKRGPTDPLVILAAAAAGDYAAFPPPLPTQVPPGVVLVYAGPVASAPVIEPVARLRLPTSGPLLIRSLVAAGLGYGLPRPTAAALAAHSGRSFLYMKLASDLLEHGLLRRRSLPEGLAALHAAWWEQLEGAGRQLAFTLAAANRAVPIALAAQAAQIAPDQAQAWFERYAPLLEYRDERVGFYHHATSDFVVAQSLDEIVLAHTRFVALGRQHFGEHLDRTDRSEAYLTRNLARHAAASEPLVRGSAMPVFLTRPWVLAQQRRTGDLRQAAYDAAWAMRVAQSSGDLDTLVRAAIITATLTTLSLRLAPETAVAALTAALDLGVPRDLALRRVRDLIDQLPDGRDKALVLRRLGESCFERGMRSYAMRMLSEALDLEVPGVPRSWRDEREETQVALARAAITAAAPDLALGITVRIAHAERRGLVETEVVRYLIAGGNLIRAEEVAHAIGHEHTHEWAMAEIAAGHARPGNTSRFREVLGTLKTATAIAWARAELACDAARHGDTASLEQVALIADQHLRDEAYGLVARALVAGNQAPSALMAVRLMSQRAVRVRALVELALLRAPNAEQALGLANDEVRTLDDDDRMPLTVLLATAYATVGDLAAALQTVEQLEAGEARDRGRSRVAAALARAGELDTAVRITRTIPDDDERGWTLHELANAYAATGRYDRAANLVEQIRDDEQRARATADLCIARAHGNRIAGALTSAETITLPAERARALSGMVAPMIARGFEARAEAARETIGDLAARSRYTLALAQALAEAGQADRAEYFAHRAERPIDRVRALLGCARTFAPTNRVRAHEILAAVLSDAATLGRAEMLTCLVSAADLLITLGSADLLLTAAHALDEVDGWWG